MGLGSTVKAIWQNLINTTSPNVTLLINNLWQQLEGAKMGAHNGRGSIFFVNGGADGVTAGLDTNDGLTPANAFLTIAHALTLVTNDNDDFIYCFNVYNQDVFPIAITGGDTMDSVHIIGVAGPNGAWPALDATPGDTAVFTVTAENVEIGGFNLYGGATHGAIEFASGSNMAWIHNNTFGHFWAPGAGQDGIRMGGSVFSVLIEDCWFYGSSGPNGTLTRYGIAHVAGSWGECTIRNNYFMMVPTCAIWVGGAGTAAHEWILDNNCIARAADGAGNAITLGATSLGCLVQNNEAAFGEGAEAGLTNPYVDLAAANSNHWCSNQSQEVMKQL